MSSLKNPEKKKALSLLIANPATRAAVILVVLFLSLQWVILGFFGWQLPPEIPLFFSMPTGSLQLASRQWFLLLPISSVLFVVINLYVALFGIRVHFLVAQLVVWFTTLYLFLSTLSMSHILFLVL